MSGDYPAATGPLERALALYQDLSSRRGEATALQDQRIGAAEAGKATAYLATLEDDARLAGAKASAARSSRHLEERRQRGR
jgi:hypothetical protein